MTQKIYQGRIAVEDFGEAMDILWVGGTPRKRYDQEPFAQIFEDDLNAHGRFVRVRYHVSDERWTLEELEENAIKVLAGAADARYKDHYSEETGYLWTDEDLNVGGHDLIKELGSSVGMYLYMIVDFYDTSSLDGIPQVSGV